MKHIHIYNMYNILYIYIYIYVYTYIYIITNYYQNAFRIFGFVRIFFQLCVTILKISFLMKYISTSILVVEYNKQINLQKEWTLQITLNIENNGRHKLDQFSKQQSGWGEAN